MSGIPMFADLRYAASRLFRSPGFGASAALILALGIGVNVAVLSVVNAILWTGLPVADSDRLVVVRPPEGTSASREWFDRLARREPASIVRMAAYRFVQTSVLLTDRSAVVKAEATRGDYFGALGVVPLAGRLPMDDDSSGVVISESFWRDWFAGAPDAIGRQMLVAGRSVTVVAVVPSSFSGLHGGHVLGNDLWLSTDLLEPGSLNAFGRLADGVSHAQASAELSAMLSTGTPGRGQRLERFDEVFSQAPAAFLGVSGATLVLTALVLLTMAANVVGLFAARQHERSAEMVTRSLLGAPRHRLLGLVACEVGLIVALATIVGAVLGQALTGPIGRWSVPVGDALSLRVQPSVDWRVFLWLALGSAAMTAGIVAVLNSRLGSVLTAAVRMSPMNGMTATAGLASTRKRLIGVQIAGALVLLVTASLFVRSLQTDFNPGDLPRMDRKAVAWVSHEAQGYEAGQIRVVNDELVEQLRAAPDVVDAGLTTVLEGSGRRREAAVTTDAGVRVRVTDIGVSASYFRLMGLTVVAGRIDEELWQPSADVVAIDADAAQRLFPEGPAVGGVLTAGPGQSARVVAVVEGQLSSRSAPGMFRPINDDSVVAAIVEGRVPAERLTDTIQQALSRVRPRVVPHDVRPLSEQVGSATTALRAAATVSGMLGGLAGLVALVGIYGTVRSLAVQRQREFGIRRALGATHQAIYALTLRELVTVLMAAVAAGLLFTVLAGLGLRPFFRGLVAFDVASFVAVPLALMACSAAAVVIPVRRVLASPPQRWLKEP